MNKYYWVWLLCMVISISSTTGAIFSMVYDHIDYTQYFIIGGAVLIAFIVFWCGLVESST